MNRRRYSVNLTVNGRHIKTVVIDPHYEVKHSATITDELILKLVAQLDGGDFTPETVIDTFEYYVNDDLILRDKRYKLIWLTEKDQLIIGVVNAYRRRS